MTDATWVRADSLVQNQGLLDVPGFEFSLIVNITHDDNAVILTVTPILSAIAEGPVQRICCKPSDLRLLAGSQSPPESNIDELIDEILTAADEPADDYYDHDDEE